jgi:hypothetical protein
MPKLLAFLPCETVIIAQNNTTSLITVLEQLTIAIPPDVEIPPDAQLPKSWHVYSLWQRLPEDEGKKFEQRFSLITPEGKETAQGILPIEFAPGIYNFRNIFNILGFPLVDAGMCRLKLSLREVGGNEEWHEVAEYSLNVVRGVEGAT